MKSENVVVVMIHTLNVADMPFEESSAELVNRYCSFLTKTSDLMVREADCRDIIMHDDFVCGIFSGESKAHLQRAVDIAAQVGGLITNINNALENVAIEKLFSGIGVDFGRVLRCRLPQPVKGWKDYVWVGPVFGNARAMARMACLDGCRKIMMTETVYQELAKVVEN